MLLLRNEWLKRAGTSSIPVPDASLKRCAQPRSYSTRPYRGVPYQLPSAALWLRGGTPCVHAAGGYLLLASLEAGGWLPTGAEPPVQSSEGRAVASRGITVWPGLDNIRDMLRAGLYSPNFRQP